MVELTPSPRPTNVINQVKPMSPTITRTAPTAWLYVTPLPTFSVNEPYSLRLVLQSNVLFGNYFPSASFSCCGCCCRRRHLQHHHYCCCYCCDSIITNIIFFPTFFLANCNILFHFYSATWSAFMNLQISLQIFISSISMKWLPPTSNSLKFLSGKNRRIKKTTEFTTKCITFKFHDKNYLKTQNVVFAHNLNTEMLQQIHGSHKQVPKSCQQTPFIIAMYSEILWVLYNERWEFLE